MSIESLVDKILDDTGKTAAEIEQKVLDEVRDREEAAEKEIQRITASAREKAARSMAERKQRMLSMAELEGRKTVLTVKQELIQEAFDRAIDKVLSLDPEAYGAFVINLILQADPVGDEEVFFNQKDKDRLGDGWVKRLNRQLIENKKKGEMRIAAEARSIRGGAILKSGRKVREGRLADVLDSQVGSVEVTFVLDASKRSRIDAPVESVVFQDEHVMIRLAEQKDVPDLLKRIEGWGGSLISVIPRKRTLEECFMDEVGR